MNKNNVNESNEGHVCLLCTNQIPTHQDFCQLCVDYLNSVEPASDESLPF